MTYPDWQVPAQLLDQSAAPPSMDQMELVALLRIQLEGNEPYSVVAAIIEAHLKPKIWGLEEAPATHRQLAYLHELAGSHFMQKALSISVASAWIQHYLGSRTSKRLRELKLKAGDEVVMARVFPDPLTSIPIEWVDEFTVSSIGANGLVYFKGGNGKCGWPTTLSHKLNHKKATLPY